MDNITLFNFRENAESFPEHFKDYILNNKIGIINYIQGDNHVSGYGYRAIDLESVRIDIYDNENYLEYCLLVIIFTFDHNTIEVEGLGLSEMRSSVYEKEIQDVPSAIWAMEYEQDPKDILDISQEHTIVCSEELGNKYKDLNLAELLLKSEQEIKALAKMKPTVYTA